MTEVIWVMDQGAAADFDIMALGASALIELAMGCPMVPREDETAQIPKSFAPTEETKPSGPVASVSAPRQNRASLQGWDPRIRNLTLPAPLPADMRRFDPAAARPVPASHKGDACPRTCACSPCTFHPMPTTFLGLERQSLTHPPHPSPPLSHSQAFARVLERQEAADGKHRARRSDAHGVATEKGGRARRAREGGGRRDTRGPRVPVSTPPRRRVAKTCEAPWPSSPPPPPLPCFPVPDVECKLQIDCPAA